MRTSILVFLLFYMINKSFCYCPKKLRTIDTVLDEFKNTYTNVETKYGKDYLAGIKFVKEPYGITKQNQFFNYFL